MKLNNSKVVRRHTHVGVMPDGRRLEMVMTEYVDHVLMQTDNVLRPDGEEWVNDSILAQYDDEAFATVLRQSDEEGASGVTTIKPMVCIGAGGRAKAFLFEGGSAMGPISLKEARILSRYNGKKPAEIRREHNKKYKFPMVVTLEPPKR